MTSRAIGQFFGVTGSAPIKAPVRVATTGPITLNGLQTVDGIALNTADRILVLNQANSTTNGIYYAGTGNWVLTPDFSNNDDVVNGTLIFVTAGTQNGGLFFSVSSPNPIVIGSSNITFQLVDVAALLTGTSTTSLAIGTGSTTFATQAGRTLSVGQFIIASSAANPANYMSGQITSYVGGNLTVNVLGTGGSGTHADWQIALAGPQGIQGAQGIQGPQGAIGPSPVFTNIRLAKTAAYTVANADGGSTIALGGSALYTLTLAGAAGYDSNFSVLALNEDTTRAKTISLAGVGTFLLWPGQSCIVFSQNNVWRVNPEFQRWAAPAGNIVFVDSTNGNDANDGLAAGAGNALQHIQTAINRIQSQFDCSAGVVGIQLATGTYSEAITMFGQPDGGAADQIVITGNTSSPQSYSINAPAGQYAVFARDYGVLTLNGVALSTTGTGGGGGCAIASQFATIDLNTVILGNAVGCSAVEALDGGHINFTGPCWIETNCTDLFYASGAGSLISLAGETFTISSAINITTFVAASLLGYITTEGQTPTFVNPANVTAQKYLANQNGVISSGGAVFPGNVAGSTSTGGQYS